MTSIFQGKRVLLVEDETLIAVVVGDMLEELGFAEVTQVRTFGLGHGVSKGSATRYRHPRPARHRWHYAARC